MIGDEIASFELDCLDLRSDCQSNSCPVGDRLVLRLVRLTGMQVLLL